MDFYKSNYQSLYLDSVRFYIENVTIAYLLYGKKCEERKRFRKDACERVWNVYRIVFTYMNLKYKIKYLFFIISPELYQKIFWIKVTKGK